jgi:hypothetical protein
MTVSFLDLAILHIGPLLVRADLRLFPIEIRIRG